eukprot:2762270-Rhodomonas_salina.1
MHRTSDVISDELTPKMVTTVPPLTGPREGDKTSPGQVSVNEKGKLPDVDIGAVALNDNVTLPTPLAGTVHPTIVDD